MGTVAGKAEPKLQGKKKIPDSFICCSSSLKRLTYALWSTPLDQGSLFGGWTPSLLRLSQYLSWLSLQAICIYRDLLVGGVSSHCGLLSMVVCKRAFGYDWSKSSFSRAVIVSSPTPERTS